MKSIIKNSKKFYNVIIFVFVIILLLFIFVNNQKTSPINIDKSLLNKILVPGSYKGSGIYSPTKLYPNGLVTTNELLIKENKDENSYDYVNKIIAFDQITKNIEYEGVRKGKYFFQPNHDNELFISAKSYVNGKIVSSQYGYATSFNKNSITFNIDCSWHIHGKKFKNAQKILTKDNYNLLIDINHPNMLGISEFTINEVYQNKFLNNKIY